MSAGLPHRSRLNVACSAGRMAETNDSSLRWGPWAELGLASGAVLGLAGACRTQGPCREGKWRVQGWKGSLASLMGPQTSRIDLTGPVHSLPAG